MITDLPQEVLVALARGAAEHGDGVGDEARRVLQRFFADTRGEARQSWALHQKDQYRWSKMPRVRTSPVDVLRAQRQDRDAMIGVGVTSALAP